MKSALMLLLLVACGQESIVDKRENFSLIKAPTGLNLVDVDAVINLRLVSTSYRLTGLEAKCNDALSNQSDESLQELSLRKEELKFKKSVRISRKQKCASKTFINTCKDFAQENIVRCEFEAQ